jgi:hypothetical protein
MRVARGFAKHALVSEQWTARLAAKKGLGGGILNAPDAWLIIDDGRWSCGLLFRRTLLPTLRADRNDQGVQE